MYNLGFGYEKLNYLYGSCLMFIYHDIFFIQLLLLLKLIWRFRAEKLAKFHPKFKIEIILLTRVVFCIAIGANLTESECFYVEKPNFWSAFAQNCT